MQCRLQQGWQHDADDTWGAGEGDEPQPPCAAQRSSPQAELGLSYCAESATKAAW
jgi:hypothetical protein